MNARFARRLLTFGTLEIGGALVLLILAGALLAFRSYTRTLMAEERSTLGQVSAALQRPSGDSLGAGGSVAGIYLPSDLVVILLRGDDRTVLSRAAHGTAAVAVSGRRGGRPPSSSDAGPFGMPVVGIATALGLAPVRARVGSVNVLVRPADGALVETAASYGPPVAFAIVVALGIAFAVTRALVAQIVRPLVDVQRVLERFAAGDLTPEPIAADVRADFGALAVAFNGAIAQVERAFTERERALAAVRQFSADAGHQLRTPLTVVRGFIAILRKGGLRTPEDGERILATMDRQSALMASLIDKLMLLDRWERADEARPQTIDVARFVADVVAPIGEAQPARTIDVDAPPGPLAAIDPSDLMHALTNLVDNALKYTAGAVRIAVGAGPGCVLVRVADDGPGMSQDDARHAFDRFYRGSRRDIEGSGLGLAIARRAIERAGGTLDVVTHPAAGTTFTLRLPTLEQPVMPAPLPPPAALRA